MEMSTLSPYDRRRVPELIARLDELDDATPGALSVSFPAIHELLGAPVVGVYTFDQARETPRLDSLEAVGTGAS